MYIYIYCFFASKMQNYSSLWIHYTCLLAMAVKYFSLGLECYINDLYTYYNGKANCTVSGRSCQYWNVNTPHLTSVQPAFAHDLASNYCRRLGGKNRPWCYTTDPDVTWEYCPVPECQSMECLLSADGREYTGTMAVTASGKPCLSWVVATLSFQYGNYTRENYCRNIYQDESTHTYFSLPMCVFLVWKHVAYVEPCNITTCDAEISSAYVINASQQYCSSWTSSMTSTIVTAETSVTAATAAAAIEPILSVTLTTTTTVIATETLEPTTTTQIQTTSPSTTDHISTALSVTTLTTSVTISKTEGISSTMRGSTTGTQSLLATFTSSTDAPSITDVALSTSQSSPFLSSSSAHVSMSTAFTMIPPSPNSLSSTSAILKTTTPTSQTSASTFSTTSVVKTTTALTITSTSLLTVWQTGPTPQSLFTLTSTNTLLSTTTAHSSQSTSMGLDVSLKSSETSTVAASFMTETSTSTMKEATSSTTLATTTDVLGAQTSSVTTTVTATTMSESTQTSWPTSNTIKQGLNSLYSTKPCLCGCKQIRNFPLYDTILQGKIPHTLNKLRNMMTLEKATLSRFKSKKISVHRNNTFSRATGAVAIAILVLVSLSFFLIDMMNLAMHCRPNRSLRKML